MQKKTPSGASTPIIIKRDSMSLELVNDGARPRNTRFFDGNLIRGIIEKGDKSSIDDDVVDAIKGTSGCGKWFCLCLPVRGGIKREGKAYGAPERKEIPKNLTKSAITKAGASTS